MLLGTRRGTVSNSLALEPTFVHIGARNPFRILQSGDMPLGKGADEWGGELVREKEREQMSGKIVGEREGKGADEWEDSWI